MPTRYTNPDVDHGVNAPPHSTVGEFLKLSLALALAIAALALAVALGFRWLAPWVPFAWERALAAAAIEKLLPPTTCEQAEAPAQCGLARQRQQYLQTLAQDLSAHMAFAPDMPVTVHWLPDKTPNAFATLGGHVVVFQGLIDSVQSENGLAMVLAHELAHVRHRDPLASAGSAMAVQLALAALMGQGGESFISQSVSALMGLHFSRRQENAADAAALLALQRRYGHAKGADEFFAAMLQRQPTDADGGGGDGDKNDGKDATHTLRLPEFLQTHPHTQDRLAPMRAAIAQASPAANTTALPAWLQTPKPAHAHGCQPAAQPSEMPCPP